MKNNTNHFPTKSSNTATQACAACKYQRRKCTPDCVLAPYFPHDRHRQFLNAHKLFGVSNITKTLRNLDHPALKDQAMRTIIFQSDVRAVDPAGGCYRIIRDLHHQIEMCRDELDIVLHQLSICRAAAQNQPNNDDSSSTIENINGETLNVDNFCCYDEIVNNNDQSSSYQEQYKYFLESCNEEGENVDVVPLHGQINAWEESVSNSVQLKQPENIENGGVGEERQEFKFEFEDENERGLEELSLSLVSS